MKPPNDIRRRALLVVNRKSRGGTDPLLAARRVLAEAGIEVAERPCPPAGSLSAMIVAEAAASDLVIVGGGDGTLNASLEGLVETGLPLGILPMGTGNDLARTLAIPTDAAQAARVIAAGRVRRIDLGWVNGKHFLNVASVGVPVWLAQELTRDIKRRWGRLGYAVGALNAWRRARPFKVHIRCDGHPLDQKALMVAIGNGRHFGGGMVVAADARIDDARLNLFTLAPCGLARFVTLLPWLKAGRQDALPEVTALDGISIDLETVPALPVNTDGEITTTTPARFRVRPEALPVLVPAEEK